MDILANNFVFLTMCLKQKLYLTFIETLCQDSSYKNRMTWNSYSLPKEKKRLSMASPYIIIYFRVCILYRVLHYSMAGPLQPQSHIL